MTFKLTCMETSQVKWDTENLRCERVCMLDKKENYYTELRNTITTFNYNNNSPLSNANIREAIVKLIMEDEVESIMDVNNFTSDAFCHTYSSQR